MPLPGIWRLVPVHPHENRRSGLWHANCLTATVLLDGLLTFEPAGARAALEDSISGMAAPGPAAGASRAADSSVVAAAGDGFLSLLGMLLGGDGPPAQLPAEEPELPAGRPAASAPSRERRKKQLEPAADAAAEAEPAAPPVPIPAAPVAPVAFPLVGEAGFEVESVEDRAQAVPAASLIAGELPETAVRTSAPAVPSKEEPGQAVSALPAAAKPEPGAGELDFNETTESSPRGETDSIPPLPRRPEKAPSAEIAFAVRIRPGGHSDSLMPALQFRDTLASPRVGTGTGETPPAPPPAAATEPVRSAAGTGTGDALTPAIVRPERTTSVEGEPVGPEKALRRTVSEGSPMDRSPATTSIEAGTLAPASGRVVRPVPAPEAAGPAVRRMPRPEGGESDRLPGAHPLPVASAAGQAAAESGGAETNAAETPKTPPAEPVPVEAWPANRPGESVRRVSLEIRAPESERRVTVDMVERGEGLEVAVRSDDGDLTSSLRSELGDLVARLERSGFHADTGSGDRPVPPEQGGQETRPESGAGERDRRRQPVWTDETPQKRKKFSEEDFTWHLRSATGTT